MLLIPKVERISSVNQIKNIKEVERNIMVYTTDPLLQNKQKFALINNSVQFGSIGAVQSKSEILYTVNCYYGDVWSPVFPNPTTGSLDINPEAQVMITNYGYIYRHIDESGLVPDIHTTNWFSSEFNQDFCEFKDSSAMGFRQIMPSDPRFYSLDQQIKMTDSYNWFFVDDYPDFGPSDGNRTMRGVEYSLGSLIDNNTTFRAIQIQLDDPYKLLSTNLKLESFINGILTRIINYGMLMLAKEFKVIIDRTNGFKPYDIKRSFKLMEKRFEQMDIKKFYTCVQNEYKNLCESPWNIRITIVFDEFKTYLQILPNDKSNISLNSNFTRDQIESYIEDCYNSY